MKLNKIFKIYLVIWAFLLAAYNAIVFSVRALPGFEIRYDARFWVAWVFIILSFIGQLACAYIALSEKNRQKLFLKIPLVTQSYSSTVLITIVGGIAMLIPDFPAWIAAIICIGIFALSVIAVIKTFVAGEAVSEIDDKVKVKTFFVKSLTVDAESLMAFAQTDEIKTECKKVYEAVRFSDPMSNDALASVEGQITVSFAELSDAVKANDAETVKKHAKTVLILLKDRNNKCKLLK